MGAGDTMAPPGTARTNRTCSSRASSVAMDTSRMNELAQVKRELEEALRQVKAEMRQGGATKSQMGGSTSRSQSVMSDVSGTTCSSAMPTDWEAWGKGKRKDQGLTTRRPK